MLAQVQLSIRIVEEDVVKTTRDLHNNLRVSELSRINAEPEITKLLLQLGVLESA